MSEQADAAAVERIANRYLLYHVGDCTHAGPPEPTEGGWRVPIICASILRYVGEVGALRVTEAGEVVFSEAERVAVLARAKELAAALRAQDPEAEQAATILPAWIPTSDRLPLPGRDVRVHLDGGRQDVAQLRVHPRHPDVADWVDYWEPIPCVTHWAELLAGAEETNE
jgi:hypothetical protein